MAVGATSKGAQSEGKSKVLEFGQYTNGQWVASSSKDRIETRAPATGRLLATFPNGNREDVVKAIAAAEKAFPAWSHMPPPKRGEILLRAAQIIRERKAELGHLVSEEMGKALKEGLGDTQEAIDFFEYIAGEGRRLSLRARSRQAEPPARGAAARRARLRVVRDLGHR